jgi:hypothetical protein
VYAALSREVGIAEVGDHRSHARYRSDLVEAEQPRRDRSGATTTLTCRGHLGKGNYESAKVDALSQRLTGSISNAGLAAFDDR